MALVIIFGPPAVGKMAVGKIFAKNTDFKLLHNHMTIELLIKIFEHGTPQFNRLDKEYRFRIFSEFAQRLLKGLVFTVVWSLDDRNDFLSESGDMLDDSELDQAGMDNYDRSAEYYNRHLE